MEQPRELNILMLEDNESDLFLVLQTLNNAKLEYRYKHVDNMVNYLEALKDGSFDIILSDYGLPGYNGLAAFKDKTEQSIPCPFILVTGSLPDEIAVECLQAGVDDYILKDRLHRLPDAVLRAIDRNRLEDERKKALQELIRSQKRLEAAEHMAKVGNWEWAPLDGTIVWSDEMYRITGADRNTYTPNVNSFMDLILPEDQEESMAVATSIASGELTDAESRFRIRTFDGQIKMLRSIFKNNGKPVGSGLMKVFGTMQDITLQFLTEHALRELTEELEQRVNERTEELSRTNRLLARKNEEMTDSINYARLIQKALLAKLDECKKLFPSSFVLWLPKDIVSGDFYWQYHSERYDFIAVVDCTGHGVPGAMMSMVGHQLLNELVIQRGLVEPAEILQQLDMEVARALFLHDSAGVTDGMDIILCRIDSRHQEVCFSGALRPLFMWKDGIVQEFKLSRNAIGSFRYSRSPEKFPQQCHSISSNEVIYLTTDGYYSQFGGPNGRKILKSGFKDVLSAVAHLPMDQQYTALLNHLRTWQGSEPQIDDILVIGIRF